jgi:hypothetical protein
VRGLAKPVTKTAVVASETRNCQGVLAVSKKGDNKTTKSPPKPPMVNK